MSSVDPQNDSHQETMSKQPADIPLILASGSPRRRTLMAEAGFDFEVVLPTVDEPQSLVGRLTPSQQAEALAFFKARSVQIEHSEALLLGADTICAAQGEVLGKPNDVDDARRMLRMLSSTRHKVITGVALLGPDQRMIASNVTHVTMRPMSEMELEEYIDSGEWCGKAGAYAIQETGDRFITNLEGSFTNVVGLPMELVTRMLAKVSEETNARCRC